MKNLRISKKLIITFAVILVLFVAVVVTSILSLYSTGKQFTDFYNTGYKITNKAMDMRRSAQMAAKFIGYSMLMDETQKLQSYLSNADEQIQNLLAGVEFMKDNFRGDQSLLDKVEDLVDQSEVVRAQITQLAIELRNAEAANIFFNQYEPLLDEIQGTLIEIDSIASKNADQNYDDSKTTEKSTTILMIVLSVAAIVITVLLALYITKSLTRPISEIEKAAKDLAAGNLDATIDYRSKDELGVLSEQMRTLASSLKTIIADQDYLLGEMAAGNFDVLSRATEHYIGDFHSILVSMRKIKTSLSDTLSQINQAADQVSSGSEQVSSGAQALSQGATEQASSVEELAATINEISEQVKSNATHAMNASNQANSVGDSMLTSNEQMQNMIQAMDEISSSSNEIGKIIKTIEDIAFQTNILALNAAVEAARAGAAGKGFAVVADEVRNLASKSADASKNTSALIESSLHAVENGTRIAGETAKSLVEAVQGAKEVVEAIDMISQASGQQADAITQVTVGVDQISSVVQTNSATAEESAAASEELSGQAQMLKNLVSRFRLAEGASSGYNGAGNGYLAPSYQTSASPVYESTPSFEAADDYNDSYSDRESVPGMDMNSKY